MPNLPGTPEHFFDQLATFFKKNAQGEIRMVVIAQTSVGQLWIHATHPDLVWQFGMTRAADVILSMEYQKRTLEAQHVVEKQEVEEDFVSSTTPTKGKAN